MTKRKMDNMLKNTMAVLCFSLFANACVADNHKTDVHAVKKTDYKINDRVTQYVHKTTTASSREKMKQLLARDFQRRIDEGYTNVGMYKAKLYVISDIQIVHKDGKKALLFASSLFKDKPDGMVKMYAAQFSDDTQTWSFNDGGKPTFYYEYSEAYRHGVPFTHHELIARTIDKLVADGLLGQFSGVSQNYLATKWF